MFSVLENLSSLRSAATFRRHAQDWTRRLVFPSYRDLAAFRRPVEGGRSARGRSRQHVQLVDHEEAVATAVQPRVGALTTQGESTAGCARARRSAAGSRAPVHGAS
eukprot:scaffold7351_cov259-Pinguiococcus_pyrenoidosus.AAC.6